MPLSPIQSALVILVTAATTFLTRAVPFLLFGGKKALPKAVAYLGAALPPTIIAVLLIFCIKDTNFGNLNSVLPQIIAIAIVLVLHLWKRNNLLSIGIGTVVYMVLVQVVFT